MVGARIKFHWIPVILTSPFQSSKVETVLKLGYLQSPATEMY